MLGLLIKKQFTELFRGFYYDQRKGRLRSKGAVIGFLVLYAVLIVGFIGGLFFTTASALCPRLTELGLGWLYFTIMALLGLVLGVFGSVFSTYSILYLAKDNDQLLSLPIPVRHILVSRLLMVYLMGLLFSAAATVPAVIVYAMNCGMTAAALIGGLLYVLLVSLVVLLLSCVLGWVVAKLSLKLKNKSMVTVLISLAFIGLYYFGYFKAMDLIRDLIANVAVYGPTIREKAYGVYLFGSVGLGDPIAIAVCTAAVAAFFGLMWYLLGRSFLAVATATGAGEKVKYTARREKQRSAAAALLKKEFGRLTSSANYMLNCAMSTLLIPILAVLILIKGPVLVETLNAVFGGTGGAVTVLFVTALCTASAMNDTAAAAVSLEGRNVWIAQSLPVEAWQVLRAKLRVQMILTMPALLLASVCAAIVLKAPAGETLALLVLPQVFALFFALLALTLDLTHANLHWTSELAPIKQSMPVFVALFGSFGYAILLAAIYLLLTPSCGAELYLLGFAAVTGAASLILYLWLRHKGGKIFMDL